MFEFIRNIFRTPVIEIPVVYTTWLEQKMQEFKQSDCYQYLDWYLKELPNDKLYTIQEVCAGEVLSHKWNETTELFTYSEMNWYVRSIFLPEHPPRLIIRPY